jgi:hypothetical protein
MRARGKRTAYLCQSVIRAPTVGTLLRPTKRLDLSSSRGRRCGRGWNWRSGGARSSGHGGRRWYDPLRFAGRQEGHRARMAQDEGRGLLTNARGLVASSWTQHADARAADGTALKGWDKDAASWSLMGALVASYDRLLVAGDEAVALGALASACLLLGEVLESDSLEQWNDQPGRTQADVLAALDAALIYEFRPPVEPPFSRN